MSKKKYTAVIVSLLIIASAIGLVYLVASKYYQDSLDHGGGANRQRHAPNSDVVIGDVSQGLFDSKSKVNTKLCKTADRTCALIGDIPGWRQVFVDNFTKDAATGSFGTKVPDTIIYTGDNDGEWYTYPDGWPTAFPKHDRETYQPHQVLSVHDGVLDFKLSPYEGRRAGGNLSPVLSSGSNYQVYGRYDARMKVVHNDVKRLDNYKVAWLLWPERDRDWEYAESDFPEMSLGSDHVKAASHYGGDGAQEMFYKDIDVTEWHIYTQEWGPGYRKYYLDGELIGTATRSIWDQKQRWQLQTEPSEKPDTGSTGHVLVDWVSVYALDK